MKKEFLVSAALFTAGVLLVDSCTKPGFDSLQQQKINSASLATGSNLLFSNSSQTLVVSTFADGTVGAVNDIAIDASGNKYVSDGINNCIRKITPSGTVSILAGGGPPGPSTGPNGPAIDGPGATALFGSPQGIAIDTHGNLYVADAGYNRIRKVEPDGFVSTVAGSGSPFSSSSAGYQDGSPINAKFDLPIGIAVDTFGKIYIADAGNSVIRVISGFSVSTLAGTGTNGFADGGATTAQFTFPTGVAVDAVGNIYVSDNGNNRIRKITPARIVSTLAGSGTKGSADGVGSAAQFNQPFHLSVDIASGNIFLADQGNFRIRKITPAGVVSTYAGFGVSGSLDGAAAAAEFAEPSGVDLDASGNAFVSDGRQVREISLSPAGGVYTVAGNGTAGLIEGTGAAAQFNSPDGIAVDNSENVYIADQINQRIRIMNAAGTVSTFAGTIGGFRDGIVTTARFNAPTGLAIDNSGNVYVADQINQSIRKITPAGVVSTIAGNGIRGYVEGPGSGAEFRYPTSVAVDGSGNVFVADLENYCIRKITPSGVVSTLAGSGAPGFADNAGTAAQFAFPEGIALDASGNIYVADKNNHRIRKVTPGGVVSTLAGTGKAGYADGAGNIAQFSSPIAVSVDASGNVLVTDRGNQRIRKITPAGLVSTLAGSGVAGSADGIYSQAQFNNPFGIAADASGAVYVGDQGNNRIRKIQ